MYDPKKNTMEIKKPIWSPEKLDLPSGASKRLFGKEKINLGSTVCLTPIPHLFTLCEMELKNFTHTNGWYHVLSSEEGSVRYSIVHTLIGGSNLLDCMCFLAKFGVRNFIFLGYCGGLDQSLKLGDVIIPIEALNEIPLVELLNQERELYQPNKKLYKNVLGFLKKKNELEIIDFPIITTFSISHQTQNYFHNIIKTKAKGIDLETSALFWGSLAWDLNAISILIVSDLPAFGNFLLENDKQHNQHILTSAKKLVISIIEFLDK
jgi:purine-nucleoside phosphorylase